MVFAEQSAVLDAPSDAAVLIAHPDGDIHELAYRCLNDRYTVRRARTFQAAVKIAGATPIDVAILGAEERHRPRQLYLTLKQSRPHLRAIFVLNESRVEQCPGLTSLGAVLPHFIDAPRLRSAVGRALSLARMSSGVHALRRDLADVSERLSSIPPAPAKIAG